MKQKIEGGKIETAPIEEELNLTAEIEGLSNLGKSVESTEGKNYELIGVITESINSKMFDLTENLINTAMLKYIFSGIFQLSEITIFKKTYGTFSKVLGNSLDENQLDRIADMSKSSDPVKIIYRNPYIIIVGDYIFSVKGNCKISKQELEGVINANKYTFAKIGEQIEHQNQFFSS